MGLILKHNFHIDVNGRFCTTWMVTLYIECRICISWELQCFNFCLDHPVQCVKLQVEIYQLNSRLLHTLNLTKPYLYGNYVVHITYTKWMYTYLHIIQMMIRKNKSTYFCRPKKYTTTRMLCVHNNGVAAHLIIPFWQSFPSHHEGFFISREFPCPAVASCSSDPQAVGNSLKLLRKTSAWQNALYCIESWSQLCFLSNNLWTKRALSLIWEKLRLGIILSITHGVALILKHKLLAGALSEIPLNAFLLSVSVNVIQVE